MNKNESKREQDMVSLLMEDFLENSLALYVFLRLG